MTEVGKKFSQNLRSHAHVQMAYFKRFGKERPAFMMSVEERARSHDRTNAARKESTRRARAEEDDRPPGGAR
jgi:hypothetical protein